MAIWDSVAQEREETFIALMVAEGHGVDGLYPLNAAWRQTSSYWEMVYSMARHGIVNPDYWVENNGEGLFLFAKVAPTAR